MKKLLYAGVLEALKKRILDGTYEVDALIPTEAELEEEFAVSKVTVRRAVEILVQEGYLEKKSGKGTRVISDRIFNKLSKAVSFTSILEDEGYDVKKRIVGLSVLSENDVDLSVSSYQGKIICLDRIYLLNDKPYALFKHYVPYQEDYLTLGNESSSLYGWLSLHDYVIDDISDKFSVCFSDDRIRENLGEDLEAVLKRVRRSYNSDGKCIEHSVAHYDVSMRSYEIQYKV